MYSYSLACVSNLLAGTIGTRLGWVKALKEHTCYGRLYSPQSSRAANPSTAIRGQAARLGSETRMGLATGDGREAAAQDASDRSRGGQPNA
mmetsp:Transcript_1153/g.4046  ORF Transcript_1153/g.4046 Transcript_1153/m.4046 type:complete len:91 (+) Transcript_1153:2463-2735(+)|eukprot:scaffold926_cov408-Prasinococcus_capsulatus_cf.AAC.2